MKHSNGSPKFCVIKYLSLRLATLPVLKEQKTVVTAPRACAAFSCQLFCRAHSPEECAGHTSVCSINKFLAPEPASTVFAVVSDSASCAPSARTERWVPVPHSPATPSLPPPPLPPALVRLRRHMRQKRSVFPSLCLTGTEEEDEASRPACPPCRRTSHQIIGYILFPERHSPALARRSGESRRLPR